MKVYQIIEARKNPDLNPKTPINDIIGSAVDTATADIAGTKNLFVSFTSIDKLGLNPLSKYDTPIGIYAYPAEYVKDTVGKHAPMTSLPFAGEQPYVNLFNVKGNIINVATIGSAEVNALYKKIVIAYVRSAQGKSNLTNQQLADQVMQYVKDAPKKAKFSDYFGGQLWYVTWAMSNEILAELWNTKPAIAWNKLFRLIGVDGCIDFRPNGGVGIIHTSEPTQAVFFSSNAITNISRYANSYSPDYGGREQKIKQGAETHATVSRIAKELKTITDPDEAYNYLYNNGFEHIRLVKNQQLRNYVLSKRPTAISALKAPSAEEQFVAIKSDPVVVDYINNPDEAAVIKSLQTHSDPQFDAATLARRLPTASETLQQLIIKRSPSAAKFFKSSYPSVIRDLVDYHDRNHGFNPSWLVALAKASGVQLKQTIPPMVKDIMQENKLLMQDIARHKQRIVELQTELAEELEGQTAEKIIAIIKKSYQKEIAEHTEQINTLNARIEKNTAMVAKMMSANY